MAANGLTTDQLRRLRAAFSGEIVTPSDGAYEDARRLWNVVIDRRPAVVVRPATYPEVAAVIRFAREHDLEPAGPRCLAGMARETGMTAVPRIGRPKDLRVLRIDAHVDDTTDTTDHLGQVRCPTLVVSGGRDLAYPPARVGELVAGLSDVRHIVYPNAGHMGPGRVFAEDACAFLGERTP